MSEINQPNIRFTGLKTFFIFALFLILLNSFLLYNAFEEMRRQQGWVQHTAEVLSEIDLMFASVTDAESGVRGYLLTQRRDYLQPYFSGTQEMWQHFAKIKLLTVDNQRQRQALVDLQETFERARKYFSKTLSEGIRKTKGVFLVMKVK